MARIVCLLASLLSVVVQAGEKMHIDYSHGHSPEWLDRLKTERDTNPNKEHLFVHLLTHSHDDVGWLKTVDEYYSGTN